MTIPASARQLRNMLMLRERREQRARAVLERSREAEAAAAATAERASAAMAAQRVIQRTNEERIYHDMLNQTLSLRRIETMTSQLAQIAAELARCVAEADAAAQAAMSARDAVDAARRAFQTAHHAHRKWTELAARSVETAEARAAVVDEFSSADAAWTRSSP
jgi:Type III secretion protein YscO